MKAESFRFGLRISAVLWFVFAGIPLFAQGKSEGKAKPPFPKINIGRHVRGEEGIKALGSRFSEVAEWHRKTQSELAKLLRKDKTLWVSPTGRLMYGCELEAPLAAEAEPPSGSKREPIASFPLDQTFQLHSLPGSRRVIYLDFNGATVTGTAWNDDFNNGSDIHAAPFNMDSNPNTFNATELQRIQNIWKRVAEDYSPFDVDVTTEEPSADALERSDSDDPYYGNRVVITPTNFYPNSGGVSYVGAFDDVGDYYKTSWVFSNILANYEKFIAEACSHENGHSVGLSHAGKADGTVYYEGHGDWAPIMGNPYNRNVTQWAKGEYSGADNTDDQLQLMQDYGLNYYSDDHGDTADAATLLAAGSSLSESGFIERSSDGDVFKFFAGSGPVTLDVKPAPLGPDLKILAELRDSDWNLIDSSALANMGGAINKIVAAGAYYLSVTGIGSGDPATTGYSDYGSLGQYVITGTVPEWRPLESPIAVVSVSATSGEAPLTVVFSSTGSSDDIGIVSYTWDFGDGSAVSTNPNPSHVYSSADQYEATLTVTDSDGLTGSSSISIIVNPKQVMDRIHPTISIVTPAAHSRIPRTVTVRVKARDNVGVTKVYLYVDGRPVSKSTTAPFTTSWNSSRASKGRHVLRVKAYDAAGNTSVASVTVIK